MKRRTFVAFLGVIAGCNSTTESTRPTGTQPSTATQSPPTDQPSTETGTPVQTTTATEEPEPTASETPTVNERRAAEELAEAASALTDVVDVFTAGSGSELTTVTAASTGFPTDEYELQVTFAAAQKAYLEAMSDAVTAEQKTRAARLRDCWQFLREVRDTQTKMVEGYSHLVRARDALERNGSSTAHEAVDELATARQSAARRVETLRTESTVDGASAIEAITEAEYQDKLSQFSTELGVYSELDDVLHRFAEGVNWLRLAQAGFDKENRNVPNAESKADKAHGILSDVTNDLDSILDDVGSDASLAPMLESLRSMASEKTETAGALEL